MNPTLTNIPIEEIVANSRLAFMHGKYDEALRLAKQALEQDSNNMSFGDYESAIDH